MLSRTGVFTYTKVLPDGTVEVTRQLRHPEDVFEPESLATLIGLPVTNEHPDVEDWIKPENATDFVVGMTANEPKRVYLPEQVLDEDSTEYIKQTVSIFDPKTIDLIETGAKREVSLGYELKLVDEVGEWNGQKYDKRQTNIRYNHLSLVKKGRCGRKCSVIMDGEEVNMDGFSYNDEEVLNFNTKGEDMIFNHDGKEYEVKDDVHALLTSLNSQVKNTDGLKEELESTKAKLDAVNEKLAADSKSRDAAEESKKFQTAVKERVALEKSAGLILGTEVNLDDLGAMEIKKKVVTKLSEVNLDGKSDAYVDARFDICVEEYNVDGKANNSEADLSTARGKNSDAKDVVAEAKARAWERDINAWKGE